MSASSVSIHDSLCEQKQAVSFRLLLGLYGIIPICLLIQCFDSWFWHDYLRDQVSFSPYHFVLFQILFGAPHIVASNIVLVSNVEISYSYLALMHYYMEGLTWQKGSPYRRYIAFSK
jgi:hypothetical protein